MSNIVMLTDTELVLLDGQVSKKVQKEVNKAKTRLGFVAQVLDSVPESLREFVGLVLHEAASNGELICHNAGLSRCPVCGDSAGYATYKRASRHRRGGDPGYSRPLSLWGIELARRFVRVAGSVSVGCCQVCWKEAKPCVAEALAGVVAEIPEAITGHPPTHKKYGNYRCAACCREGHEGELLPLPAVFGGCCPGGCPSCHAGSLPFGGGSPIGLVDGFVVVEVADGQNAAG